MIYWELTEGMIDTKFIHDFLAKPSIHSESGCYLLLDNASIHRASKKRKELGLPTIEEQLATKNIVPTYLPAYSPQLNPVELLFNVIRHNIEKSRS